MYKSCDLLCMKHIGTFNIGADAKTCVKSDRTNDPLKKKLQNLNQRLEEYVNDNKIEKKIKK